MNFQSKDGYFVENVSYDNIGGATRTPKNHVALTAHVLVALEETADVIQVVNIEYSHNRILIGFTQP